MSFRWLTGGFCYQELLKIRSGGLSAVLSSGSESESEHVPNSQFYNLPPPRATRTSPRDTGRPSKCFKDMVTGDRDDADDDDDSMDDFIVNEEDEEVGLCPSFSCHSTLIDNHRMKTI